MWVKVSFFSTFVLELILKVLVGSLQEDLREDLRLWAYIICTPTNRRI